MQTLGGKIMLTAQLLEIKMSFGENLKRLRRDKGWTQSDLSKATGIKLTHIPRLEKEQSNPKLETLYQLINGIGCSADSLLLDSKKVGIDSILKANLERVTNLPEQNKRVLVDVIDKYCIAVGIEKTFNENNAKLRIWTEAPDNAIDLKKTS